LIRPGYRVSVYCDKPIETNDLSVKEIPLLMDRVHKIMSDRVNNYWANVHHKS